MFEIIAAIFEWILWLPGAAWSVFLGAIGFAHWFITGGFEFLLLVLVISLVLKLFDGL